MSNITKQKTNSIKYSPLVYKYFAENNLTDISNKLREYKRNSEKSQEFYNLMNRLYTGLQNIRKDKKNTGKQWGIRFRSCRRNGRSPFSWCSRIYATRILCISICSTKIY